MRLADPSLPVTDAAYLHELVGLTEPFGVSHTGVASAEVLHRAREAIRDRVASGFADGMKFTFKNPERSTDPKRAVRDAQSVFVAAKPYLMPEPPCPPGPVARISRYAWVDHYAPLRQALGAVVSRLRADGFKAMAFADDNSIVDREVAYQAGIGWFGKNANLLLPGAGSWFVLGCVVTTASLPVAAAPVDDGCGSCRKCLDACPTGAIVAPGVIDGGRCLAWVLQKPGIIPAHLRQPIGARIYGCDDCQEVCPPTIRFSSRRAVLSPSPSPSPSPDPSPTAWLAVLDLLRADDVPLLAIWGTKYLAERDPRWIRRNALVVLGNVADGADVEVQAVLVDYLSHPDPVLRAHAAWAAGMLGLHHLLAANDPHPDVQRELEAAR